MFCKRIVASFFVSLLLQGGCMLETRSPQIPSTEGNIWELPTSPSIVLTNLENAYERENLQDYLRSFSSDFLFLADPRDTLMAPRGRYAGWTDSVEERVTKVIFALGTISLEFAPNPQDQDIIALEEATIYRDYRLEIVEDMGGLKEALGEARFSMRKDREGYWAIFLWEDIRKDSPDWGELKGGFR